MMMSKNAQVLVDHLVKFPNLTSQQRVEEFTRAFQTWYTGGWVGMTNSSAYSFFYNHGGSGGTGGYYGSTSGVIGDYSNLPYNDFEIDPFSGRAKKLTSSSIYRGQTDFNVVYREASDKELAEDQTHHFAAYFALGVAGLSTAESIAQLKDQKGGGPDSALGTRAYNLGNFYRKYPEELKNVAYSIKAFICD